MTVLSADREVQRRDGKYQNYGVIASDIVYKNSLVSTMFGHATEEGYVQPATNEWMNVFVGVSDERGNNASGSAGDVTVNVYKEGTYEFEYDGTPSQALIGEIACVVDDQTVSIGSGSNCKYQNPCGVIVGILGTASTSNVLVRIDNHVDLFPETFTGVILDTAVIARGDILIGTAAGSEVTVGADTTATFAVGIAIEIADNTGDGLSVRYINEGVVMLDGTQAIANYMVGEFVCVDGARAVDTAADVTEKLQIGKVVAYGGTNDLYVKLAVLSLAASDET